MAEKSLSINPNIAEVSKFFGVLYGKDPGMLEANVARYDSLLSRYRDAFGGDTPEFFSSPGRTEISGNHTDHNGGKVVTASINLDTIAAASPNIGNKVVVHSEGYPVPFKVDLNDLERKDGEWSEILIRGLAAGMKKQGYCIGGFNAFVSSNVANGSGLSSSAAFEMLLLEIMNSFFNANSIPVSALAKIGQFAENTYWNKPSGLLDQMGCGTGGLITIDFRDPADPRVTPIKYDFSKENYKFLVVHTGGDHGNLTPKYAQIPKDMWAVAELLGVKRLCDTTMERLFASLKTVREKCGDRCLLRAVHFFEENARVDRQVAALQRDDFASFLRIITESGSSSWRLLQNCYEGAEPHQQNIPVALALTEAFLAEHDSPGAYRVHGGGFAGVVLVVLRNELVGEYVKFIEPWFGKDSAIVLQIRPFGAVNVSRRIMEGTI